MAHGPGAFQAGHSAGLQARPVQRSRRRRFLQAGSARLPRVPKRVHRLRSDGEGRRYIPRVQGRTARQRRGAAGRGLVGRGRVVGPVEARRTRQRRQRHTRRRIRAVHRGRPARVAAPAWWRPWASGTPWSSRRPTPCWWRTRTACRTSRRWCSVSRRTTGRRPRPTGGSTGPGEATR